MSPHALELRPAPLDLRDCLPRWLPREANVLSDQLEDVLDNLERAFVA